MKKIIWLLALSFFLSCKKSFIELSPESTASTNALYGTDKDFQDAVVGIYSTFQSIYQSFWQFGDLAGDDTEQQHSAQLEFVNMNNFLVTSATPLLHNTWLDHYRAIFRANTVLAQIDKADAAVVVNKDRHIGEAKFLRALAYFNLVRVFGDVPMVTAPLTIEEASKTVREKVDKIYDEIIVKDLQDAENKLPVKYSGALVGKATKGAAKSLLGKVYLTRKDFAKAASKLEEVTSLGYSLLPNYNDLFDYTKDEHHAEYIFDIEYTDGGLGLGSLFSNIFAPNLSGVINFFGLKGSGGQQGAPTLPIFTLFDANDKRKDISVAKVADGLIDRNGQKIPLTPIDVTTYSKKYMTPLQTANDSKANWKVIRYADVLLMYAEALNEIGKTDLALTNLNLVRARAGVSPYSALSQTDTREKIYLERRFELHLEGHRWFDLVRTGRAFEVMQPQGMKSYMTVFPIPLSQIQVINNPAIFPQNPGYN
jgi:starch-binding outer membrane protein, SusD/RagB family